MNICRFKHQDVVRVGWVESESVLDLTPAGISAITPLLENDDLVGEFHKIRAASLPRIPLAEVKLLAPVERQEVWAAGVTYQRSKAARMEESDFSASAYDKVYSADRPEIFFKSLPEKVVPTDESVGIRRDAKWNVPEPELVLVMNSKGKVVGFTVGNDMSSRDIEGENLLYLPQAKIYERSCAVGPWLTLGATESQARQWTVRIEIRRGGKSVFSGETSVGQMKRGFEELAGYLFRSQLFPHGAMLSTGTGIVPPDTFTLQPQDDIAIEITGIGVLRNSVVVV